METAQVGIISAAFVSLTVWLGNRYFNSIENSATSNSKILTLETVLKEMALSLKEISTKITELSTNLKILEEKQINLLKINENTISKFEKHQEKISNLELKLTNYIAGQNNENAHNVQQDTRRTS